MNVVDGGEHDDGHAGVVGADVVEQGEAVGAGHHDVGEDEVVVGVLLEARYGLFCAFGHGCGVAAAFEQRCDNAADGFFIVDYQDSFLRHGFFYRRRICFCDFFCWKEVFVVFAGVFEGGWRKMWCFLMVNSW